MCFIFESLSIMWDEIIHILLLYIIYIPIYEGYRYERIKDFIVDT